MKINRKEIMKRAHEIAKKMVGDWYARLALALRQAWMEAKTVVEKIIDTAKSLVIGKDYYGIFTGNNIDTKGDKEMIYNGGISWTAKTGGKEMTMDSQKTTDAALEYINRPSYKVGI
ncbi:MAG TPA: hypothetical protein DIW31_06135 [Bacteroidales bacterium]|nr:hypothetical protein [Bacteroidales bacterium]